MDHLIEHAVHLSHFLSVIAVAVVILLLAYITHLRGGVGGGDVAFLATKLIGAGGKVEVATIHNPKLHEVVDNLYLRLHLWFWLWWNKNGFVLVPEELPGIWRFINFLVRDVQKKIVNRFVHVCSEIANEEHGHAWMLSKQPKTSQFHFVISYVHSRNQVQLRVLMLSDDDLKWLQTFKMEGLSFPPALEFLQTPLIGAATEPMAVGSYKCFRP